MTTDIEQSNQAADSEMMRLKAYYKSDAFVEKFNKHLETVILATRGGGSGAKACRDTLLSLYNGGFRANLSNWYNLDTKNRTALLFILEHQTTYNRGDIDRYLPQYAADFDKMRESFCNDYEET